MLRITLDCKPVSGVPRSGMASYAAALVSLGVLLAAGPGHARDADRQPDPDGQDHAHAMDPGMYDALREKIPLYEDYTDEEIDLSMLMMGPNYRAYLSDPETRSGVGVLVLAHGFGEVGDRVFKEQLKTMARTFPTAIGFGMSMTESDHIQAAVDDLTAAGAETIVVIPALSSPWNTQMRQWEYMFDIHDNAGYLETDRIKSDADVFYTGTLKDHPLVAEILLDYALELAGDPASAEVIVVSHGPTMQEDNERTLAMLAQLAGYVKQDGGFAAARSISLQNDAPPDVRDANVTRLREWVATANDAGREVVIVTNLLATRSIQSQIREDLSGLDYQFNSKGLTQHSNFRKWIQESVRRTLAKR